MTRYEEHEPLNREQLKQEIRREIKRDEKKRRLVVGLIVLVLFFLLLSMPFLAIGVIVAKSGLAQVPLLSEWFYNPVEPTKIVLPLQGSNSDTVLTAAIARINYNENFSSFTLYLTEQELTTVLNASINQEDGAELIFPVESVQAVLGTGTIELFILTKREDGVKVPILVTLKPDVQDGRLAVDSTELTIGSLTAPDFIADAFVRSAFGHLSDSLIEAISGQGKIEEVQVTPEKIELMVIANLG